MCNPEITTAEDLRQDLLLIRGKLSLVESTNPKIYRAIEPLISHLINHLKKQIYFIDFVNCEKSNQSNLDFEDAYKYVANSNGQSKAHKEFCKAIWDKAKERK
jgi:hypothetical protein